MGNVPGLVYRSSPRTRISEAIVDLQQILQVEESNTSRIHICSYEVSHRFPHKDLLSTVAIVTYPDSDFGIVELWRDPETGEITAKTTSPRKKIVTPRGRSCFGGTE